MRRQPLKVWILIFANLQSQCRLWRSLGERLVYDLEKAANSKTGSQEIRIFWTGMFWTVTALVPDKLKGAFYAVSSIPISNADCELAFSLSISLFFLFFFKWTWFAPKIHSSLHTSTRSYLLFLKSKFSSQLWVAKGHKNATDIRSLSQNRKHEANQDGTVVWSVMDNKMRWGHDPIWAITYCEQWGIKTWGLNCKFCKLDS